MRIDLTVLPEVGHFRLTRAVERLHRALPEATVCAVLFPSSTALDAEQLEREVVSWERFAERTS